MKKITLISTLSLLLGACSILQNNTQSIEIDEIILEPNSNTERSYYHEAPKRVNDLLHTQLDVSFDWDNKHLFGKALLDFKPYFKAQNTLILDAKGFDLHQIALINQNGEKKDLTYKYDSLQIFIELDREYNRHETYTIFID